MRLLSVVSCYRASPAVFEIYWTLSIGGHDRVWPFRVTWRSRSRDQSTRRRPFPIGGSLEPNSFRDIQSEYNIIRCNAWHGLKRPLNKGQGDGTNRFLIKLSTFALGRTVQPQ